MSKRNVVIEMVTGPEGPCLCISREGSPTGFRFAGPKPWGGGKVAKTWRTSVEDMVRALAEVQVERREDVTR